jgi:hypothetical protein
MGSVFKKIDRRNFFRKSVKIVSLVALAMAGTNPLYSFASRNRAGLMTGNKGRLMIPSLWWRKLSKTEGGKLSYWNTAKLRSVKSNWVSASYRPLDAHNKFVGTSWVIPPKMIEKVMELAKPGLKSAHNANIQVFGTTDSMQFNPAVMRSVGIDPELLYARTLSGDAIGFDAYQKDNYMSCLMNPYWQDIETTIGKAHAEAGFDGLFLDLFPYAVREGMLCGCGHCKKGWESYSKTIFGKRQNFPSGPLQLKNTIDRTFFTWRIEAIHHFMEKIQDAGKKFNADFKVILNCNGDNPCMAYLLSMGMPQPTSELGQLNAGNESSLYLHRMIESASQDQLFAQFNGAKQYLPEYKYKTALAEAYAAGGALMLAAKNEKMDEINGHFTGFLLENQMAFEESTSDASVGILFSWRDHTFLQRQQPAVRTDRMQWSINSARRTAAILASKGIPYDYIFVEKGITQDHLSRYEVIIAPELKLLDDNDADAIKTFVDKGGKLFTLGSFGILRTNGVEYTKLDASRLKSWTSKDTGSNYLETMVGKGMICAVGSYITGENESDMATTPAFNKAADFLGLDAQLKVQKDGNGRVASTIRKNGLYRFIHLIRYACSGEAGETGVQLLYRIPAGVSVQRVTGVSPYSRNKSEALQWKTKGDHLAITTSVELYTMIRIELSDKQSSR